MLIRDITKISCPSKRCNKLFTKRSPIPITLMMFKGESLSSTHIQLMFYRIDW